MKVVMGNEILQSNKDKAEDNRTLFSEKHIFVANIISSPGAGKTTLLENTISSLKTKFRIGVIEGDIFTTKDADRIAKHCEQVVQINTTGGCHLDANLIALAAKELDLSNLDIIFIENVGNLICPAEFDLGEQCKITALSVTEGDDKPSKYPFAFSESKAVLITKIDLLPYTNFDMQTAIKDILAVAPNVRIMPLSSVSGEGLGVFIEYLSEQARNFCR